MTRTVKVDTAYRSRRSQEAASDETAAYARWCRLGPHGDEEPLSSTLPMSDTEEAAPLDACVTAMLFHAQG